MWRAVELGGGTSCARLGREASSMGPGGGAPDFLSKCCLPGIRYKCALTERVMDAVSSVAHLADYSLLFSLCLLLCS